MASKYMKFLFPALGLLALGVGGYYVITTFLLPQKGPKSVTYTDPSTGRIIGLNIAEVNPPTTIPQDITATWFDPTATTRDGFSITLTVDTIAVATNNTDTTGTSRFVYTFTPGIHQVKAVRGAIETPLITVNAF